MTYIQPKKELEDWYNNEDPWGYETNPEDEKRKGILLSEIPSRDYKRVLDIGCGNGFITRSLYGAEIIGVDVSNNAIKIANSLNRDSRITYKQADIFELDKKLEGKFDLIVITGVLYSQYIGKASKIIYKILDQFLSDSGVLISVHIDEWYVMRFPYLLHSQVSYPYREYNHIIEVYIK